MDQNKNPNKTEQGAGQPQNPGGNKPGQQERQDLVAPPADVRLARVYGVSR